MSSIDDEEADMNSSCAAVSQILLSLEDSLLNSPHNKLSSPPRSVVDCENVLRNHDSESTVDGASLALDDNRLVSASPVAANDRDRQVTDTTQRSDIDDCDETQYVEQCCGGGLGLVSLLGLDHTYVSVDQTENSVSASPLAANDHDRQVTDTTQISDIDDCDETQYVEQCCGGGLGLVPLLGLDHTYVSVDQTENSVSASPLAANDHNRQVTDTTQRSDIDDCDETQYVEQCCGGRLGLVSLLGLDHTYVSVDQTENSVALSVNNSPSLLDVSKLLQFKSSTNSTTGTTAVTSSAAVDTAAETLMRDVSTELQGQMRPEINELDTCNTVAAVCSVNDSHLTCVCSDDNPHVQLCGSGTSNDLLLAAVSSHSATHYEVMGMSNKGRPSPVAVASHVECTSSLSYAGIQVN